MKGLVSAVLASMLILSAGLFTGFPYSGTEYSFEPSDEYIANPYMGLCPWANESNDDAEYPFTLVYADVTWDMIEPERGRYDFTLFEERCRIDQWRSEGKRMVLRLVLDRPGDDYHMDIPQWLADETGGHYYSVSYGKGWCPEYSSRSFIEYHRKLLEAIAAKYADDDFLAFIELGSLGHWGEWHVHEDAGEMPDESVWSEYVSQYADLFPSQKLLMRRPFAAAGDTPIGLYNDSLGKTESTERWLGWIEEGGDYEGMEDALVPMPDAWKTNPVGGEISPSAKSWNIFFGFRFKDNLEQFKEAHTTFIGPASFIDYSPEISFFGKNVRTLMNSIGYRLYVSSLSESFSLKSRHEYRIVLRNAGVAPFYYPWNIVIRVDYSEGSSEEIISVDDITALTPDEEIRLCFSTLRKPSAIYLGIINPSDSGEGILLANDTERDGFMQRII